MYRTFKNLQNISASVLNSHTTQKNGIISIGPVYYNGQSVIISNFIVIYNGIIVSDNSPSTVAVDSESQYIYLTNITTSPDSEPYLVSSISELPGICLAKKVNGQWSSCLSDYTFVGREKDGNSIYSIFSSKDNGTIRIELRGLSYSPDFFFNSPIECSLITAKSDKETIIGSDGNKVYLYDGFKNNNVLDVPNVTVFSVYRRASDCVFCYYSQDYIYVNTWEFLTNTILQHHVFPVSQQPQDIYILNENEIVCIYSDGIRLYTSSGIQKGFHEAQKVHVLHGNIVFVKDGHVYFNFKKIKPIEFADSIPYCCGDWFIEVFGTQYVTILDGNKKTILPLIVQIGGGIGGPGGDGTPVPPSVFVCYDSVFVFSGLHYSIYNHKTKYCSSIETRQAPLCIFGDGNYFGYVYSLEIGVYITENKFPCGEKKIIRHDEIDSLTVYSNSDVYCDRVENLYVGVLKSGYSAYVQQVENVSFINIFAHDFDYVLLDNNSYFPAFYCEPSGCITSQNVDGQTQFNILSGKINIYYGQYNNVYVNAINSIIIGAKINNLYIENCRNVLFIGCEISNIIDSNQGVNQYKIVGSGGANSFVQLSDTPNTYSSYGGKFLSVNNTEDGVEFSQYAKSDNGFQYAREEYVYNGQPIRVWDTPASINIHSTVKDPIGFESRDTSTLTLNGNSVDLYCTQDTYIWHSGKKFKLPAGTLIEFIFPLNNPNIYFMYFSVSNNQLVPEVSTTFFDLSNHIPVAYVFVSQIGQVVLFEERHGCQWPWSLHRDIHLSRGAWTPLEPSLTNYVLHGINATDKQYTITQCTIADEDIWIQQPQLTSNYNILYYDPNSGWNFQTNRNFPLAYNGNTGNPQYNSVASGLVDVTANNQYINTYIFATNAITSGFQYLIVPGQSSHSSLSSASSEDISSLQMITQFPIKECVPVYKVTWRRGSSYGTGGSNPYCRIELVTRIVGERITIAGVTVTDHAALSGRSHPSCHPASAIDYISPTYNSSPLFLDTNIQDRINHIQEQVVGIANSTNGKFIYPITWIKQTPPTSYGIIVIYVKTVGFVFSLDEHMEREDTFIINRNSSNTFLLKNTYTNIKYEDGDIYSDRMNGEIYNANDFIEVLFNGGVISIAYTYGTGDTGSYNYLYSSLISVNEIYI